jgi:hypothetical protein
MKNANAPVSNRLLDRLGAKAFLKFSPEPCKSAQTLENSAATLLLSVSRV